MRSCTSNRRGSDRCGGVWRGRGALPWRTEHGNATRAAVGSRIGGTPRCTLAAAQPEPTSSFGTDTSEPGIASTCLRDVLQPNSLWARSMTGDVVRLVFGLAGALIVSACTVLDTDQISGPSAAATVTALKNEPASYVHPKLIGPDFKFERVNESSDCAPELGNSLPTACHGQWWRSMNVIVQSRTGMRISQTITQYPRGAAMGSLLQDKLSGTEQAALQVNHIASFAPFATSGLPAGAQAVRGSSTDGTSEEILLLASRAEYVAQIAVWGYGSNEKAEAPSLAARVFNMLLDRIPGRLGGPVPPDYIGNKYWDVR